MNVSFAIYLRFSLYLQYKYYMMVVGYIVLRPTFYLFLFDIGEEECLVVGPRVGT
jgi:hypothetical protein